MQAGAADACCAGRSSWGLLRNPVRRRPFVQAGATEACSAGRSGGHQLCTPVRRRSFGQADAAEAFCAGWSSESLLCGPEWWRPSVQAGAAEAPPLFFSGRKGGGLLHRPVRRSPFQQAGAAEGFFFHD